MRYIYHQEMLPRNGENSGTSSFRHMKTGWAPRTPTVTAVRTPFFVVSETAPLSVPPLYTVYTNAKLLDRVKLSYLRHLRAQCGALLWHTFCGHSTTANILLRGGIKTPPHSIHNTPPKVTSAAAILTLSSAVVQETMCRHTETSHPQYWPPKLTTSPRRVPPSYGGL